MPPATPDPEPAASRARPELLTLDAVTLNHPGLLESGDVSAAPPGTGTGAGPDLRHAPEALARTHVAPGGPTTLVSEPSIRSQPDVDIAPAPLDDHGFDARYERRAQLGEGGMGEVHLCRDARIGREVAMKVIRKGHGSRSDARGRFEREARVQGQLEHPSIVPVYDLGIGPDGAAFFTMKRVRGSTLEDILAGLRARDADILASHSRRRLLSAFSGICLGVAFAHARGVLHRDLKPANIMLGSFGELYLLDWGLAKVAGTADDAPASSSLLGASTARSPSASSPGDDAGPPSSTGGPIDAPTELKTFAGSVLGTPGYMAPEQVRGDKDLGPATDLYALGSILFELLTLEPLHPQGNVVALLAATLSPADARASLRAPDARVPPELEAVCVRATALDPAKRFASARELHEAVERFLDGDRDVEQRRKMAAEHLARAEAAMALVGGSGEAGTKAREQAMGEVGAALALDPSHGKAVAAMMRLLLDVKGPMPDEARKEFEAQQLMTNRTARGGTTIAYTIFFLLSPAVLLLGVRSWPLFALSATIGVVPPILAFFAYRRPAVDLARWVFAASMVSVAMTSAFLGPGVLPPGLVAVNTIGFITFGDRRHRGFFLVGAAVTVVVPFVLQALGLLPPSYAFTNGTITILPLIAEFPPVPTALLVACVSLLVAVAPAIFLSRARDSAVAAEERVFMHGYRLRQLIPDEARTATSVPVPTELDVLCGNYDLRHHLGQHLGTHLSRRLGARVLGGPLPDPER